MGKKVFKRIAVILTLVLMSNGYVFASETAETSVPTDVKGATYEQAVRTLVEEGIITGDTDGLFHPESTLNRAQACIIVVKSMNPPVAEVTGTATQQAGRSGFSDMLGYVWAEGYISYAVKHSITRGYPDGTFKPGNKVTMNELITMVIRASGYTDEKIGGTWPSNYIAKATELNLLGNIPTPIPSVATKWMAAQFDYNALDKIKAANPKPEVPGQGTDQDKPDTIPDTSTMTYANGSFNSTMTIYNGKSISGDVVIYTYGLEKNYNNTMVFTNKISDYRIDTVYKYKNVKTPAFYELENDKITKMVVPMDIGFSGRAYSVINDTITTLNGNGESVTGLETLTATREITWLGKKGLINMPVSAQYLNGEVYELNVFRGEVQSVFKAADSGKKGNAFAEISTTGAVFVTVDSYKDGVVTIDASDGGSVFEVKANASVYIMDISNPTEYKAGRVSGIRAAMEIRAYDISDDEEPSADIIVLKY